jgi:hypothetical protein
MKRKKNAKLIIGNILFVILCASILVFLLAAPKETTSPLPHDDIHSNFFTIKSKKEAEKSCLNCHDQDKEAPLPDGHPPKYRCLFCHKRL